MKRTVRDSHDSNRIDAAEKTYLHIGKSQIPKSGNGLFTAINIFKGETISLFKGEILTNNQAGLRASRGMDKYFLNMLDGSIMDSAKTSCFAKYANDALGTPDSGFKNNAKITIDETNNVCLEATRNIKADTEIFCNYGKRYWKKHSL